MSRVKEESPLPRRRPPETRSLAGGGQLRRPTGRWVCVSPSMPPSLRGEVMGQEGGRKPSSATADIEDGLRRGKIKMPDELCGGTVLAQCLGILL